MSPPPSTSHQPKKNFGDFRVTYILSRFGFLFASICLDRFAFGWWWAYGVWQSKMQHGKRTRKTTDRNQHGPHEKDLKYFYTSPKQTSVFLHKLFRFGGGGPVVGLCIVSKWVATATQSLTDQRSIPAKRLSPHQKRYKE